MADRPDEHAGQGPRLVLPDYDRSLLRPAVVHIGVGGFHRAHQAVYFDELAREGEFGWGVVGVGVRSHATADALAAQDHLFTVVECSGTDAYARVVGSVLDVLVLAADRSAVRRRLADPQTRLVTLTITGDGYVLDSAPGEGNLVFETIVAALAERRAAGLPGFTVLSCDNLPDSAAAARHATTALARAHDAGLAQWIDEHVSFPASMVDRITPATSDEQRAWVEAEFTVSDRSPVVTEAFAQWVIEDRFCNGRPPLDRAGARFVTDVTPYKLIKSRLLNGSHSALGYVGYLAGHRRTDEAMADPAIAGYLEQLMRSEIAPSLPDDVPGMELDDYTDTLLQRFANSAIRDPLARLCARGTTKMPGYLLPSLHAARAAGRPHPLLTLALASWLRYLRGTDLKGTPIDIVDPREDLVETAGQLSVEDEVRYLLRHDEIFGGLGADHRFTADVVRLIHLLDSEGIRAAMDDLLRPPLAS